jgi:threonine/homoserine/homoserine lactone efflux protein
VAFELWLILAVTLLAGAMSPGPSVALVIRTAITHGRTSALTVALAHGTGIGVYALIVVLGLATLIQNSDVLMITLQIGGALFLFYLGCRMLIGSVQAVKDAPEQGVVFGRLEVSESHAPRESVWQHALHGFLIVFLNPKVVIFFVAIFSQFVNAAQLLSTQLVAAIMAGVIDAAWYALVAIVVSNQHVGAALNRVSHHINGVFGVMFIGFSALMLIRQL